MNILEILEQVNKARTEYATLVAQLEREFEGEAGPKASIQAKIKELEAEINATPLLLQEAAYANDRAKIRELRLRRPEIDVDIATERIRLAVVIEDHLQKLYTLTGPIRYELVSLRNEARPQLAELQKAYADIEQYAQSAERVEGRSQTIWSMATSDVLRAKDEAGNAQRALSEFWG